MSNDDTTESWEDLIVGDRMAADRKFQERVQASSFSNQSWGLVMMAVEFEIANPEEPERAHLTADSEQLDNVLPAMKEADEQMGLDEDAGSSGVMDSIRGLLGNGRKDDERRAEAEQLAQEYADLLQRHLQDTGKWERVCARAADAD